MRAFDLYMQLIEDALEAADHSVDEQQRKDWIQLSEHWLAVASEELGGCEFPNDAASARYLDRASQPVLGA